MRGRRTSTRPCTRRVRRSLLPTCSLELWSTTMPTSSTCSSGCDRYTTIPSFLAQSRLKVRLHQSVSDVCSALERHLRPTHQVATDIQQRLHACNESTSVLLLYQVVSDLVCPIFYQEAPTGATVPFLSTTFVYKLDWTTA